MHLSPPISTKRVSSERVSTTILGDSSESQRLLNFRYPFTLSTLVIEYIEGGRDKVSFFSKSLEKLIKKEEQNRSS